ncbi:hypothetical protein FDH62_gp34 [Arthrobacter phage Pumancara]|uniref:Uncharacterized protein n=1 Tax=Arthrobacter phage Pumancara TaxID=1772311 RepID=A0A0U4KQG8_9CAUD|nr:hypothetical protein FDH62_gp34 [Arthrobacter phage Pumancara]ALY09992.1 hypothetical protein PUMANCARA_34 [Arthrobacter phage Pumancara]
MSNTTADIRYDHHGSGSPSYAFKTELELEVGDHVLVKDRGGIHLGKVVRVPSTRPHKATAWAFQKVDLAAAERAERKGQVLDELKTKIEEQQTMQLAYLLAEKDPTILALIKELEA